VKHHIFTTDNQLQITGKGRNTTIMMRTIVRSYGGSTTLVDALRYMQCVKRTNDYLDAIESAKPKTKNQQKPKTKNQQKPKTKN